MIKRGPDTSRKATTSSSRTPRAPTIKQASARKPATAEEPIASGGTTPAQTEAAKGSVPTATKPAASSASEADNSPDDLLVIFAKNLRAARMKLGLTQADVAERAGLPQQYVSTIELGRQNITLKTVGQLAQVVGRNASAMLRRSKFNRNEK